MYHGPYPIQGKVAMVTVPPPDGEVPPPPQAVPTKDSDTTRTNKAMIRLLPTNDSFVDLIY